MGRFKYNKQHDQDSFEKTGKIRRGQKAHRNTNSEREPFVREEKLWVIDDQCFRGRVVEVQKRYAFVVPEPTPCAIKSKDVHLGTIARKHMTHQRGERNLISVGDIVRCRLAQSGEEQPSEDLPSVVIEGRTPRTSEISRCDPMNPQMKHILACNVDQLLIVASFLQPRIKWGLIDRYLALAEEQRIPSIIVLNKSDLLDASPKASFVEQCHQMTALYQKLGYTVITMSALNVSKGDPSFLLLEDLLRDKISLLSGHSGVGKSSVVNLFDPEIIQDVEDDPDIFYKGRHTTTYASFIGLQTCKGWLIDTPGIRSFVLGTRTAIELTDAFVEFRPYLGKCKFRECRHIDEPECRIQEALARNEIHPTRYRSYKMLLLGDSSREGRSGLLDETHELDTDVLPWEDD